MPWTIVLQQCWWPKRNGQSPKNISIRLNYEDIENLNKHITSKEIELVIKYISTKKRRGPDDVTGPAILLKLFQKIEGEDLLPDSFCKVSITLISKSDKETERKLQTNILNDIDVKIFNKMLVN